MFRIICDEIIDIYFEDGAIPPKHVMSISKQIIYTIAFVLLKHVVIN